ncbi:hypothetical protein NCC49_003944 [Naganishia albida]|nr:hypothetical protein NCC49_003944 [Naganishia albida]
MRLLLAAICRILGLSPLVASFYVGSPGSFPGDGVVQHQVYNITWGPVGEVSYVDVYLGQQRNANDTFLGDRRFEQLVQGNVTDMPFKWNVSQPVDTTWVLTLVPMGYKANLPSFTGINVVAATSGAGKILPNSAPFVLAMLLAPVFMAYLAGQLK